MSTDQLSTMPAYEEERLRPNAVDVLLTMVAQLNANFRTGVTPSLDFPSQWRLARHVVDERAPLDLFYYGDEE